MTASSDSDIFRELMRLKPEGMSPNAWAVRAGVSRTVWADMRRHDNPSRRTLERLLTAAGSNLAEFEALRVGSTSTRVDRGPPSVADPGRSWSVPTSPTLPLFATAAARADVAPKALADPFALRRDDIVDQLSRPRSLAADPDAFALTVIGDSMWPRFAAGRCVAVSPRAAVAPGDDVLVLFKRASGHEPEHGLIKHLVSRDARSIEVRQFNPDSAARLDANRLTAVFKVLGELI